MDNAGGGLRGWRAVPSDSLLTLLSQKYALEISDGWADLGGSSNLNLLMRRGARAYVARVYRPCISVSRLADIQLARRRIAEIGIPCPQPIPTFDGDLWTFVDSRLVEVEEYVERDADMDTWERVEAGLPILARIHTALEPLKVSSESRAPRFVNHIQPEEALEATAFGAARIRSWIESANFKRLADSAEELARLVDDGEQELTRTLPRQLVHGDFWDNNVFFRDGQMVLVNDFDHMGERARIDDLALTLYFTHLKFPMEEGLERRMRRLCALVDAYESGLASHLTRKERASLPLAIARQPLWSIGGWIATLDDDVAARSHADGMHAAIEFGLSLVRDLPRWQRALA
jgi:Ser/Thr protein kinase RdoA (MazF antagonist)